MIKFLLAGQSSNITYRCLFVFTLLIALALRMDHRFSTRNSDRIALLKITTYQKAWQELLYFIQFFKSMCTLFCEHFPSPHETLACNTWMDGWIDGRMDLSMSPALQM